MFTTRDVLSIPCPQSQYNCCKKINCGSEYPFTADRNSVSDVGDWFSVTGRSICSSVPSGSAKGRVMSEGFTSRVSDKGLLCVGSCSLKAWSSTLQSGVLSVPEMEVGKYNAFNNTKQLSEESNPLTGPRNYTQPPHVHVQPVSLSPVGLT